MKMLEDVKIDDNDTDLFHLGISTGYIHCLETQSDTCPASTPIPSFFLLLSSVSLLSQLWHLISVMTAETLGPQTGTWPVASACFLISSTAVMNRSCPASNPRGGLWNADATMLACETKTHQPTSVKHDVFIS
jgi:hypothetical protein